MVALQSPKGNIPKRLFRLMSGKPLASRRGPPPFPPWLGWMAGRSSRAEEVSQGGGPRKGQAFPHIRRQSRFFRDFNATLTSSAFQPNP
jgi:hypothetical protein